MKFYGHGIVWPIGRFEDGEFETDDPNVIELLKNAGFKYDPEPETDPDPVETEVAPKKPKGVSKK